MKVDSTDKRVPSFIQFTNTNSSSQSSKRRSARLANEAERGTKRRKTRANAPPSTSSSSRRRRIPLKENDNDPQNDRHQQTPSIKDDDNPVTGKNEGDILNDKDNNDHHTCNKTNESAKENDHSDDIDDDTVVDINFNHQSHSIPPKSPNKNDENPSMPPVDHSEPDEQGLTTNIINTPHRILEFKTITISPNHGHQTTIPPPPPPPPSLLTVSPPTSPLITNGETCSPPPVVYYTPLRTDLHFEQDTPSQSLSDDDYYSAEGDSDWDV